MPFDRSQDGSNSISQRRERSETLSTVVTGWSLANRSMPTIGARRLAFGPTVGRLVKVGAAASSAPGRQRTAQATRRRRKERDVLQGLMSTPRRSGYRDLSAASMRLSASSSSAGLSTVETK